LSHIDCQAKAEWFTMFAIDPPSSRGMTMVRARLIFPYGTGYSH
jgi:hypothetical protein